MPERVYMRAPLQSALEQDLARLRLPTATDVEALGELMYRSYLGTIDYAGETLQEAVAEIQKTYAGEYGRFDPEHSCIAERAGRLVSATLITRWEGRPFVAFTMTEPSHARQGLARATLQKSMQLLQRDGESELRLVVTLQNEPALRLYESLGFVRED